jgi:hypothetical protein
VPRHSEPAAAGPWAELLDAIEGSLIARERARRDGTPLPQPVRLPAEPGPIPAALEPRARRVLGALDEQERALAEDLAAVRAELARVSRLERAAPRTVTAGPRGGFSARA